MDTPGIKSFGIWDLDVDEVEQYFEEIHALGQGCGFTDCTHTHEENCAVKAAVDEGGISPMRFVSYLTLMESILSERHNRR